MPATPSVKAQVTQFTAFEQLADRRNNVDNTRCHANEYQAAIYHHKRLCTLHDHTLSVVLAVMYD